MTRPFLRQFVLAVLSVGLAACGGGSDDDDDAAGGGGGGGGGGGSTTQQGVFIDGPVDGLGYQAGTAANALTASGGKFDYKTGDTVKFFVGAVQLGSATGAARLSPREIADGDAELNIARFLMALDSNGDPADGITIDAGTRERAQDLAQPDFGAADFDSSAAAAFANAEAARFGGELPTRNEAQAHLACSLDNVCPLTKIFEICPSNGATAQMLQDQTLKALFDAREGDTVQFCAGTYVFTTGLFLHSKRGVTIKGAGKNLTTLNFDESGSSEGVNVASSDGIVLRGFTVQDTPGNAIRIFRSKYVTLDDVRALWSDADPSTPAYDTSSNSGAYGLYPVECRYVLIENSESIGASDAGVYVGQTSDVIVRKSNAEYNVAGYEFENTYRAVFEDNVATNNVGGFLVFDLPGLRQYGEKNIVRNNHSVSNNTENFAPIGNIVGLTPRGTGMLILATDQLEVYGNTIKDNDTVGIALVNFGLANPDEPDQKYDFFPEGVEIRNNIFENNGGNPQEPNPDRGAASFLPYLILAKNHGRSAHIVWDGAEDTRDADCAPPVDDAGQPLTSDTPSGSPREEPRNDERGRPNFQRSDPEPSCKYNRWKFNDAGQLKRPENSLCIKNNSFLSDQPATLGVGPFFNFKVSSGREEDVAQAMLVPGSSDLAPHDCDLPERPVPTLQSLGLPFVPDPNSGDARPSPAEVAAACVAPANSQVNYNALSKYNCPQLSQYGLFLTPTDPRSTPNGGGVPFELNSALFSDYAVKYRVLYLPPNTKAVYKDHGSGATATLDFPLGTVIAKTFAFRDDTPALSENVVETRLLIKRQNSQGVANWVGLPYLWQKDAQGALTTAVLRVQGAEVEASYDYLDPDPDVKDAQGNRLRYTGTVERYGVPASLTCISCHSGDDREAGAAPIGPKPRLLNRDNTYGGVVKNQLQHLVDLNLLQGLPALASVEKHPRWNVAGDSGSTGNDDIHQRVRAYLEVNCMHCHNPGGNASNSGLFLDSFRRVNIQYGICKEPVAAGRGSGDNLYDLVPGAAADSILNFRVNSAEAGIRMPPLARTVVHGEAAALITQWTDNVLPTPDTEDEEACTGTGGGGVPLPGSSIPLATASSGSEPTQMFGPLLQPLTSADQRREQLYLR